MDGKSLGDINTPYHPILMKFNNLVGETGVCMKSNIKYDTNANKV